MDSMVAFGRSMVQLMWVQICAESKMNVRPLRPTSVPAAKHEPLVIDWQANYERAMAGRSADIPRGSEESSIPLVPVQDVPTSGRVTIREAASILHVSYNVIRRWIELGKVSVVKEQRSHSKKPVQTMDIDELKQMHDRYERGEEDMDRVYTVKAVHKSAKGGRWCPMGKFSTYAEAEEHMKMLAADDPTHAYTFEVVQMR